MQRISIFKKATILLLFFTIFSCEKDALPKVEKATESISVPIIFNVTDTEKSQDYKRTVLGDIRENPYTVENLATAMNEIYGTNIEKVVTSDLYVKFEPQSVEDIVTLEELDLMLFDFPLEREVIDMGDYYFESATKDDYPIYWTVVKSDFVFPAIKYEILAELNLNMEADPFLMRKAFELTGNLAEAEERFPISDDLLEKLGEMDDCMPGCDAWPCCLVGDIACDETSIPGDWWCNDWDVNCYPGLPDYPNCLNGPGNVEYNDCGCLISSNKRYPGGCVQVEDTQLGMEGVRNVKIIAWNGWFRFDQTSTNDSGCWNINRDYRGKAWFWVKFKNDKCRIRGTTASWRAAWQWQSTVIDAIGRVDGPNFNNIQINYNLWTQQGSSAHLYWGAATVNNALHDFHDYAIADGVPTPERLDIYVGRNNTYGYTLMHSQDIFSTTIGAAVGAALFWTGPFAPLAAVVTWAGVQIYLPEVYVGIDYQRSGLLKRLAYHEFTHASHYEQVGDIYWDQLVIAETLANGHGDQNSNDAGIISVAESWAGYLGSFLYMSRTYDVGETAGLTWLNRLERIRNESPSHIPIGLYHDLVDVGEPTFSVLASFGGTVSVSACNQDGSGCTIIADPVSGFTNAQMFSCLTFPVTSIAQFQSCLISSNTTSNTVAQINALFGSY